MFDEVRDKTVVKKQSSIATGEAIPRAALDQCVPKPSPGVHDADNLIKLGYAVGDMETTYASHWLVTSNNDL